MVSLLACLLLAGLTQAADYNYVHIRSQEVDSSEHGQFQGPKSTTCECGWTNKAGGRIVGGRETKENEYPHMVGLLINIRGKSKVFCGGSIMTRNHVITAAHCTKPLTASAISILAGAHDPNEPDLTPSQQIHQVVSKVEHEDYSPTTHVNDIAILTVATPFAFGPNKMVGPICMPTRNANELERHYVRVTGWGTTFFRGPQSPKLLKVDLRVIRLDQCHLSYRNLDLQTSSQFCTYAKSKDACQGDSGGPVTWLDPETNRYTLMGLVSYGQACATIAPGVNTNVHSFMPWILKQIGEESVCTKA